MTKEITKSRIIQEIQDKFALRDYIPEKFLFSEIVTPVYNIEQHLEEWWQKYKTQTIAGTGPVILFTVPENERWHIKRYDVVFMTGVYTIAGVYIERRNRDPNNAYIYLDLKAAQTVSYHIDTDVVVNPKDSIRINVDGYTSTGDLRLYIDFMKEELR